MQEIGFQKPSVKELLYTGKIHFPEAYHSYMRTTVNESTIILSTQHKIDQKLTRKNKTESIITAIT